MKKLLYTLVFAAIFVSCKEENLSDYMVNSWQTTYVKIEYPTYKKSDSTSVYEDKFDNNPARIAQSKYNKDGTFVAWYLNREGERLGDAPGTWKVVGDSLFITYRYGGRDVQAGYQIKKTDEGFIGTSKHDWDADGEFDDLLIMKTKIITPKK